MRRLIIGLLFGACLSACASAVQYRYYGMSIPPESFDRGDLLGRQGSDGWPDMAFSICKPDQQVRGKCVVMQTAEFFSMKRELEQLRRDLDACQRGVNPSSR